MATTICLSEQKVFAKTPKVNIQKEISQVKITDTPVQNEFLIKPLMKIKIMYHDNEQVYQVPYDTVGNTLQRLHISLNENDVLPFDKNEFIYSEQVIVIPKIEAKLSEQNEIIKYKTEIFSSDDLLDGERKVVQQGKDGRKSVTYKEEYFNDKLWHKFPVKETILIPVQNEIIKVGTQNIIEYQNADLKSENTVLIKTKSDDNNFSLPKVKLSEHDRDLLERLLTGEFGSSFTGAALVAQAIKCAIVYDNYTSMESLISGMGYVGSTNIGKTQNAVDAAKFIFDENGLAVKHRLFYMCTEDYFNSAPGNFHSTQNFILQYENVKFFDRW
ncbi:MAG: G5 domain-containing protein [Ruminococcus sp.]|nr:G5 domain-containing protein [Ruminococcus sp.]